MSDGVVYIYALCEPDDQREIRYIGKTNDLTSRYRSTLCEIDKYPHHHKSRWLNKLRSRGVAPVMEVLAICDDSSWEEQERAWIAYGHSADWHLTNMTPGGEGQPRGWMPPRESIERVRKKNQGRKRSPEAIEALRRANTGRKYDAAHRQRCSERQKRVWAQQSPEKQTEWSEKRRVALIGRKQPGASSRYRGVRYFKRDGTWQAYLSIFGKQKHLGYWPTEEQAAEAVRTFCRENGLVHKEPYAA